MREISRVEIAGSGVEIAHPLIFFGVKGRDFLHYCFDIKFLKIDLGCWEALVQDRDYIPDSRSKCRAQANGNKYC